VLYFSAVSLELQVELLYDDDEMADFPVTYRNVITLRHLSRVFAFTPAIIFRIFFHFFFPSLSD